MEFLLRVLFLKYFILHIIRLDGLQIVGHCLIVMFNGLDFVRVVPDWDLDSVCPLWIWFMSHEIL